MYIVAKHTKVLRDPKNKDRSESAYMDNESLHITKNLKKKDITEASVILDVATQTVVKNRFSERPFDELFSYFLTHYKDYINKWVQAQR